MPKTTLNTLHDERQKLHADMTSINDKNAAEWSSDDNTKWDAMEKRYDEIEVEIGNHQSKLDRISRISKLDEKIEKQEIETRSEIESHRQEKSGEFTEAQKCVALQGWMRHANGLELKKEHEDAVGLISYAQRDVWEWRHQPHSYQRGHGMWSAGTRTLPSQYEDRASMAVSTEPEIIPEGFSNELSKSLLAWGGFRNVARILSTASGNDVPWPTWDDTGNSGALLAEETTFGTSVAPTVAVKTLKSWKYSSTPVLISPELLEDSAFNMASELGEALGIRIGRATATHYATGDDSSKPEGVTVFASAGVTAASATAITGDELIDLQDALDPAWEGNSGWAMNKATRSLVRKLKTTDLQYIWQTGLTSGSPDMLLGAPVAVIQEMPAAATGNVSVVYGDFTQYIIRDAGASRFLRLEELFRQTDMTGFIMFSRHDGRGLQTNAIKKLTQA